MNTIIDSMNSLGRMFVEFSFSMLIQSSILIVLMIALDLVLRRRVRAVFRYYLWMLVLVKLLLPTTLSLPTGVGTLVVSSLPPISALAEPAAMEPVTQIPVTKIESTAVKAADESVKPAVRSETASIPKPVVDKQASGPAISITWQGVLFAGWAVCVVVMGLLMIQRYIFVRGLIAQATPAEGGILDLFEKCRRQMGVDKRLELRISPAMVSPAACGLVNPVILMPEFLPARLDGAQMQNVLLHELAHIRRGDLWTNFGQTLLQIVYFYNPLLWVANTIIRRIREQAVDETVLVTLADSEVKPESSEPSGWYAETLLNVAKLALARPALALRMVGVVESRSALTGRIKHILDRPMPKSAKLGGIGLTGILLFACVLLPMAKGESQPSLTISGTVKDATTGKPIAGAIVSDDGIKPYRSGTTDASGKYSCTTWPEEHSVRITAPGYQDQQVGVDGGIFQMQKEKVLNFTLVPSVPKAKTSGSIVHLAHGVTVELAGVSYFPYEEKEWWRPDGLKLGQAPFVSMETFQAGISATRTFAIQVLGPKDLVFAPSMGGSWWGSEGKDPQGREIKAYAVDLNKGRTNIDITVRVAAGPWTTHATYQHRTTSAAGFNTQTGGVIFSAPYEKNGKTVIVVTDTLSDRDIRIVGIDDSGNRCPAERMGSIGVGGNVRSSTSTINIPLKNIKEFEFQTRPYDVATFKNVSLEPGKKTNAEVEVSEGEATARGPEMVGQDGPSEHLQVPLEKEAAIAVKTYSPILDYGRWGIRYGWRGKAYNVSGNRGVIFVLPGGETLLIGSQRPEELASAAQQVQSRQSGTGG